MTLITFIHPLPANHEETPPPHPGTRLLILFWLRVQEPNRSRVQRHHAFQTRHRHRRDLFQVQGPRRAARLVSDPPRTANQRLWRRLRMVAGRRFEQEGLHTVEPVQGDDEVLRALDERVHDQLPGRRHGPARRGVAEGRSHDHRFHSDIRLR